MTLQNDQRVIIGVRHRFYAEGAVQFRHESILKKVEMDLLRSSFPGPAITSDKVSRRAAPKINVGSDNCIPRHHGLPNDH